MNNRIQVYNENNDLEEIEVLDFYQLDEYQHEYILYTKNEEEDGNVITYLSILQSSGENDFQLLEIQDDEEFQRVQEVIEKDMDDMMKKYGV